MNRHLIRVIYYKEMLDAMRDRSVIVSMLVVPLLIYPLITIGLTALFDRSEQYIAQTPKFVSLVHGAAAPGLEKLFEDEAGLRVIAVPDPVEALDHGDIQAAVLVPEDFSDRLDSGQSPQLIIKFDGADALSLRANKLVAACLVHYKEKLASRLLAQGKAPPNVLRPFELKESNVASRERMRRSLLAIAIPLFLIVLTVLGSYFPALDITAGEKERGTLETLLACPASKEEILAGKFLALFSMALLSVAFNLVGLMMTLAHGHVVVQKIAQSFDVSVSPYVALMMLAIMVPFCAMTAAILMFIALLARNLREANNYLVPMLFFMLLAVVVASMPGVQLNWLTGLIPVVNITLLFRDVVLGAFDAIAFVLVVAVTLLTTLLLLKATVELFKSEAVIFRDSDDVVFFLNLFGIRPPVESPRRSMPRVLEIYTFMLVIFLVYFYLGGWLAQNFSRGTDVLMPLLVFFVPSLAFVRFGHFDGAKLLPVRALSVRQILMTLAIAASCVYVGYGLLVATQPAGTPPSALTGAEIARRGLLMSLVTVALLPAICEEIFFRGILLCGITERTGPVAGLIVSTLLFAAFHPAPDFIAIAFMGLCLGVVVLRTRNLVASMLAHLATNATVLILIGYLSGYGPTSPSLPLATAHPWVFWILWAGAAAALAALLEAL